MNKKQKQKTIASYVLFALVAISVYSIMSILDTRVNTLTYDEFLKVSSEGTVEKITIVPRGSSRIYEIKGRLKEYKENETFIVKVPASEGVIERILLNQEEFGYELKVNSDPESGSLFIFLINVLPFVILIGLTFFFITRQMGSANKSLDFGKSRAKMNDGMGKVTFENVAGLTEEKEELSELIDFLKNPKKFQKMGARIPKGVLLFGPPGTGKTLLARAVAGEANVPFYFISGSDFVELFVGVGASRVRDMFKQAKATAPCLIFIDEIDAVGRQRGTGLGGGHDEREQTLNQLLTEMDGFSNNEGIIIIAATNRPDVLDPALLRPGRFDRQVTVNLPDAKGREEILAVHAKGKTLSKEVTFENVAQRTVGFSGADLENLLNEAALLTVRRNKEKITMSEIDEAQDRVLMGPAKRTKKYSEYEKSLVAHHEAGHVVMGLKLSDANDVQKVTIIPRGYAGGYAMMMPKEEKYTATKKELLERIAGLLGGRVAEELIFSEVTTGAQNDFEQATKIARAMVTEFGMSSLGPVQFEHSDSSVFLGRDYNKVKNFSTEVANQIDEEVRKIINSQYEVATKILKENIDLLKKIAELLIKHETLTKEQIEYIHQKGEMMPEEVVVSEDLNEMTKTDLIKLAKEKKIKVTVKMTKEQLIKELESNV